MPTMNDFVVPALIYGCLYSLVATSFNIMEKSTRVLNFATGYLIMWAPMTALIVTVRWHLPPALGIVLGIAFSIILALLVELVSVRPFIGQDHNLSWILSTWGAGIILAQLAISPFQGQDEPFSTSLSLNPIRGLPVAISAQDLLLVGLTAVVALGGYLLYRKTRLGLMLVAISEDFEGARAIGISPGRMSATSAGISALVGAVAGLAFAPVLLVYPDLGANLTFPGFVAAALGGLGSISGGFVGAFAIGAIIQATAVLNISSWSDVALFGTLLAVFLIKPTGLFGQPVPRQV
jgi:branched-chain amino acid transport system permease protein